MTENDANALLDCLTRKGLTYQTEYTPAQTSADTWEITLEPRQAGDVCQLKVTFLVFKVEYYFDVHRLLLEERPSLSLMSYLVMFGFALASLTWR